MQEVGYRDFWAIDPRIFRCWRGFAIRAKKYFEWHGLAIGQYTYHGLQIRASLGCINRQYHKSLSEYNRNIK